MDITIRFSINIPRKFIRGGLSALILLGPVAELGSESVVLTTYYPAPSGVYANMITTGNTLLSRNSGNVGIGTASPTEKLEVNGNIKFTVDGSIMSKAPRHVHSTDPRAGCPPFTAVNTDFWTMPFTLTRTATVLISGDLIRNKTQPPISGGVGRADLKLYVDGVLRMQALTPELSTNQWASAHVQWTGTLAPGIHTVSMQSPQADVWGCGGAWGTMDALIFEN